MIFKPAQISLHHFRVTLERENEGDIDVDANRYRLSEGRGSSFRSRNLDHPIRAADTRPQLLYLSNRRLRIICNIGTDLKADKSITAIGLLVQRAEQIARYADIFNSKLPKDFFRVPTRPRH